jgi:hypothetical protein
MKPFCSQSPISVIICRRDPRTDSLRRTLETLQQKSLPLSQLELRASRRIWQASLTQQN